MKRDFKHRASGASASRKRPRGAVHGYRPPPRPWPMFALGLLLGVVVGVAAMVFDVVSLASTLAQSPSGESAERGEAPASDEHDVQFSFYDRLPEMEVVVESDELDPPPPAPAPNEPPGQPSAPTDNSGAAPVSTATPSPPSGEPVYLLQVASFKRAADAEAQKAKLAFLGLRARVQTVTVDGTQTWHRVVIGPLRGKQAMRKDETVLRNNGYEPLVLKLRKRS